MILIGFTILITVFVKAYKSFVIGQNSIEIVELGRETIRRGSTLIVHGSHRLMSKDTVYQPLTQSIPSTPDSSRDRPQELRSVIRSEGLSQSLDDLKRKGRCDFVRSNFNDAERETLIRSDNTFILSEHRRCRVFKLPDSYFS